MRLPLALVALVSLAPAASACEGLSPGDHILSDGASCTLAFVVANADGLWLATAGHCVALGATVTNDEHGEIGVAAFRHLVPDTGEATDGAPGEDFALIRVHPQLYAKLNPKVCGWDGPTGLVEDGSADGGGVRHYGHGLVFGEFGPATQQRQGVNLITEETYAFHWTGAGVPGDSGSAVLAEDGRALGVLTHLQVSPFTNGGTHLLRGFQLAEEAGFKPLRLVLMGEDPVAVLAEMQPGPRAQPPGPAPGGNATTPANGTAPGGNATRPEGVPGEGIDGEGNVTPAGDAGGSLPGATTDDMKTPGAPLALGLLALAAVALGRRR